MPPPEQVEMDPAAPLEEEPGATLSLIPIEPAPPDGGPVQLPGICCECLNIERDAEGRCFAADLPAGSLKLMNGFLDAAFQPYTPGIDALNLKIPPELDLPGLFELPPIPLPGAPAPIPDLPSPPDLPSIDLPAFELPDIMPAIDFLAASIMFPVNLLINASLGLLDIPPQPPTVEMLKIPNPLPIPDPNGGPPPPMAGCFAQLFAGVYAALGGPGEILGNADTGAAEQLRLELKRKLEDLYGDQINYIKRHTNEAGEKTIVANGQGESTDGGELPQQFRNAMAGNKPDGEGDTPENEEEEWDSDRSAKLLANVILGPEPNPNPPGEEAPAPAGGDPIGPTPPE
jgi:hypothetical protein